MLHISDAMVDAAVDAARAQEAMAQAFREFGQGRAAMQQRERIETGGVKLSTLGAVIPGMGVAGAKVYTTIAGRFTFVILLFSARDGRPLATVDAAAVTRKRTAACSVLMAQRLAPPGASRLGVCGLGVQGIEHAAQLCEAFAIEQVRVAAYPGVTDSALESLAALVGVPVNMAPAEDVASGSHIIVTASRSATPLFRGETIAPGAFIAAVGSSLPHTRELDDAALARARTVVVEWRRQALAEAGDLVLAAPELGLAGKLREFSEVLDEPPRSDADGIHIYKAVGVGLQDVALAGYAYRVLADSHGWPRP